MRKNLFFIVLIFLFNSIFSYSNFVNPTSDKELQKIFDRDKEVIVVYRLNNTDSIAKKYIENKIPKEEYNALNNNHIVESIKYIQKNKFNILAEVYIPNGSLAVKTEIKLRKEILFNEIEKLVQEITDNEGSNQSDILNNKFSDEFLENVKSFTSYSYYDDGSLLSKTEYNFDMKNINMLTYSNGKVLSETKATFKGSIQDENMDIDFYENLTKSFIKMKVKKVENGQEIRTFYPNGNLKSIGIYKDSILNGSYKEYNIDGSLKKETLYKDGVEVKK